MLDNNIEAIEEMLPACAQYICKGAYGKLVYATQEVEWQDSNGVVEVTIERPIELFGYPPSLAEWIQSASEGIIEGLLFKIYAWGDRWIARGDMGRVMACSCPNTPDSGGLFRGKAGALTIDVAVSGKEADYLNGSRLLKARTFIAPYTPKISAYAIISKPTQYGYATTMTPTTAMQKIDLMAEYGKPSRDRSNDPPPKAIRGVPVALGPKSLILNVTEFLDLTLQRPIPFSETYAYDPTLDEIKNDLKTSNLAKPREASLLISNWLYRKIAQDAVVERAKRLNERVAGAEAFDRSVRIASAQQAEAVRLIQEDERRKDQAEKAKLAAAKQRLFDQLPLEELKEFIDPPRVQWLWMQRSDPEPYKRFTGTMGAAEKESSSEEPAIVSRPKRKFYLDE
jgi:hypothetical protein